MWASADILALGPKNPRDVPPIPCKFSRIQTAVTFFLKTPYSVIPYLSLASAPTFVQMTSKFLSPNLQSCIYQLFWAILFVLQLVIICLCRAQFMDYTFFLFSTVLS